eukprot:CAMPEP_0116548966 /NCGR_PEP_ID=MMETSP0397-20121206/4621_1 /TAXON_ID=216820 /ORGANISM="Cyclophora tenuis, Strain ECT3854" /LENGTH=49 /DNA_ID=CAMNT_0004073657 /DNA_START=197 /DNA_END=346 /DNA_ORIENTATION=-
MSNSNRNSNNNRNTRFTAVEPKRESYGGGRWAGLNQSNNNLPTHSSRGV